jgi:hypothetical protein
MAGASGTGRLGAGVWLRAGDSGLPGFTLDDFGPAAASTGHTVNTCLDSPTAEAAAKTAEKALATAQAVVVEAQTTETQAQVL